MESQGQLFQLLLYSTSDPQSCCWTRPVRNQKFHLSPISWVTEPRNWAIFCQFLDCKNRQLGLKWSSLNSVLYCYGRPQSQLKVKPTIGKCFTPHQLYNFVSSLTLSCYMKITPQGESEHVIKGKSQLTAYVCCQIVFHFDRSSTMVPYCTGCAGSHGETPSPEAPSQ